MQVKAEVIESKVVTVHVDPREVLQKLYLQWRQLIKKKGEYVNREGYWESWDDTGHGSGITDVYEKATDEEIEIMKSFEMLKGVVRVLEEDI